MRIAEIVAVVFGLFLGITAFSAGQGLAGSLILVVAVLLLFFGQERKGPVYLRPWIKKCFRKKPDASVDQVPEKHTAHQPDAVPDISQPMQKACSAEKKTELIREPIHQKNSIPCAPSKSAEPFEDKESGITYQLKPDGTAEVTYCSGWHSSKTIPETISGYRVTSIGANAFPKGNCCSLSVPASVTEIKSLPEDFTEKVWDRPRFDLRENAMDIDELVLVERTYSVFIHVKPGSYAERYCKEKKIHCRVK